MEQSIDSNKKPEFAAGTDPAFIPLPGLAAPVATRKPETESEAGPKDAAPEAEAERDDEPGAEAAEADADQEPEAAADHATAEDEGEAVEEGPVFEVSDRRGSIRVAREGVRFTLDDQEAEFHWDEIGAVETTPARFGRRFTVTVHLSSRRWFNAEVEAASRAELKGWPAELDTVLDAYFEES
ncbi:hypothetical protein ASD97_27815 [Streptomyces sp. Root63]|uniref:hypothetical protein n=1 Tax=Streptomyces TaxID=1883 RepID=UPI000701D8DA|nr:MULTISPECIES: hypothetical protein [Streptomyces]KQX43850.1 hypothetical protein ASD29_34115 [Streptomyces sp. Root1295]KRA34416.1 hypothetical protein ASD97_27815 [Streptomyces sp. Root63]MBT1103017.1 hypothetical protein [Streptomyces sp. Tu10]WUC86077.1 hypothetical protein OHQ35_08290 [Streptomyces anulatus]WUD88206.1 hypothetical protein OG703_08635 [Streptomyces anulatus]